ncbi:hypothetical protein MLD52_19760 [Puniceicoccaceae bacterium K14]|nr:hypothetical protein [Puniceicoccaceae bacterium K14]
MDTFGILIGLGFVGGVIYNVIRIMGKKKSRRHAVMSLIAGVLLLIGAVSFFSTPLASILPKEIEWPIGYANQIFRNSKGEIFAVDTTIQRIQTYSEEWIFLRGFSVDARGGVFKVRNEGNGRLRVFTARGNKELVYSQGGELLETWDYRPKPYDKFPSSGRSGIVPTPLYLIPFASPFLGWLIVAVGGGILMLLNKEEIVERFKQGSSGGGD